MAALSLAAMLVWVSVSKWNHHQRAKTAEHVYSRGDKRRRIASPAIDQHTFVREYSWVLFTVFSSLFLPPSGCADEAIDATAETFSSGRISALKEMKTLGKLMIEQDMRALGA